MRAPITTQRRTISHRLRFFVGLMVALLIGISVGHSSGYDQGRIGIDEALSLGETLAAEKGTLAAENGALISERNDLQSKLSSSGTFTMWDKIQTIRAGNAFWLGLPDTFTVHIQFTATVPVLARIMAFDQFVAYRNGRTFNAIVYPVGTSLDVTFHNAEGCAGYLLVIEVPTRREVTITPNVVITRNPSPVLTGACAD